MAWNLVSSDASTSFCLISSIASGITFPLKVSFSLLTASNAESVPLKKSFIMGFAAANACCSASSADRIFADRLGVLSCSSIFCCVVPITRIRGVNPRRTAAAARSAAANSRCAADLSISMRLRSASAAAAIASPSDMPSRLFASIRRSIAVEEASSVCLLRKSTSLNSEIESFTFVPALLSSLIDFVN